MQGGPQIERARLFGVSSALRAGGDRDDLLSLDPASEKVVFEGELSRLRRENGSLKDSLTRALRELKAYQLKYPSAFVSVQFAEGDGADMPAWTTAPEIMSPLFEAYDSRVKELETIATHQANQLNKFQQKLEALVAENEQMREHQLESLRQTGMPGGKSVSESLGLDSTPINAETLAEMNERVDILMAENAMIVEQKNALALELDGTQEELRRRTEEVGVLSQQLSGTARELQSKILRGLQAERDRDEAAKQAVALSDDIGRIEREVDELRAELVLWQQKSTDSDTMVSELKRQLRDVKENSEEAAAVCMKRNKLADDRVKELHSQLLQKTHELDTAQEVLRKLRREYQSTRLDAEGMLQVMSGLERQISEYASREAEIEKAARDGKESIEQALVERDQALAREDQNRREIEKLLDERKKVNIQHQGEIDSVVEVAKQRAAEQVKSVELEMQAMMEATAKVRVDAERAIRESKTAAEVLERVKNQYEDEKRVLEITVKELRDTVTSAIVGKDEEMSRRLDVQEMNKELRGTVDKLRLDIENLQNQLNMNERGRLAEVSALKTSNRELQQELLEKTRSLAKKCKDYDDLKSVGEDEKTAMERKLSDEVDMFRRRAVEAEKISKEMESASVTENQRCQSLIDQLKEKTSASISQLTGTLRNETEASKKLASRVRELEIMTHSAAEEKAMLISVIEEARSTINDLQEDLRNQEAAVLDLSQQLANSHVSRDEASKHAAKTIESLHGSAQKSLRADESDELKASGPDEF